ncbi:MAG: flavodoxin domain-containing protein [Gammaproteobacteria bacterium]|nr:flavodoxin domain-containing protein [Gammaproteobacteria bacterium]
MNSHQAIKISDRVYWVGAIDWELRDFHGYSTSRGTTYNAYLVLGSNPILIDTVKAPFWDEMLARISSIIDPTKIDYIISNHAEMDHSGCLERAIETFKPKQVFASKMGIKALEDHFHFNHSITELPNKESLTLGDANFTFLETRMLHWPDSMFTYFANDGILFSQDGFGMHLATSKIFADQNDPAILRHEAAKYYANILLPYSNFVTRLLAQFPSFNLDVKMIAPDHGPIWRNPNDINTILNWWSNWAAQKFYPKAVIAYDTMWQSTAKMAHSIADGLLAENIEVKVMPLSGSHRSDIIAELLEAGAFIVGSPTINQQLFPTVAAMLCYFKGLKPQNLIGQVFGSYGWGAEAIKLLQDELKTMQIELVENPVSVKYVPTAEVLTNCRDLGINIAKQLTAKLEK